MFKRKKPTDQLRDWVELPDLAQDKAKAFVIISGVWIRAAQANALGIKALTNLLRSVVWGGVVVYAIHEEVLLNIVKVICNADG